MSHEGDRRPQGTRHRRGAGWEGAWQSEPADDGSERAGIREHIAGSFRQRLQGPPDVDRDAGGGHHHRKARGSPQHGRDGDAAGKGGFRDGRDQRRDGDRDGGGHENDAGRDAGSEKGKGKDKDKARRDGRDRTGKNKERVARRNPRGDWTPDGGAMSAADSLQLALAPAGDELAVFATPSDTSDRGIIAREIRGESTSIIAEATHELMVSRKTDRTQPPTRILMRLHSELKRQDCPATPDELADLAYVLGKLYVVRKLQFNDMVHSILSLIAQNATVHAEQLTPPGISNIACGFANFASLGVRRSKSLMSVMASEVVEKAGSFEHRFLAQTAWAFAKCSLWHELLASSLARESQKKIESFTPQSLSQLSWAMSQWLTIDQNLTDALVDQVCRKAMDMPPNPLATITLALATLKVSDTDTFKAISDAVMFKVRQFKAQDLANIAYAYVKLSSPDPQMFEALAVQLQHSVSPGSLTPAEMCDIAWAFSQTKSHSHHPVLGAIAGEALQKLSAFHSADVANLMWSFAVAQVNHKGLAWEVGCVVARNIGKYTPQHLSSIARAYGALAQKHTEFMSALSEHVHRCLCRASHHEAEIFKPSHLSNIAYAFATLGVRSEEVLRLMAPTIMKEIGELRPMFLARCARAYRMLSVRCPELMTAVVGESLKKLSEFATRDLQRVADSLYVSLSLPPGERLEEELTTRMVRFGQSLREACLPSRIGLLPSDEYLNLMKGNADFGCSLSGSGPLLRSIDVDMPSRDFMRRCFAQARKSFGTSPRADDAREYTAAEVSLSFNRQEVAPHHEWFIRDEKYSQAAIVGEAKVESLRGDFLLPMDVACRGHRDGRSVSIFLVLQDICRRVARMGVVMESAEARASLGGTVEMMSTTLPDVLSIGALRQFDTLFPNVSVTFAERIVRTMVAVDL